MATWNVGNHLSICFYTQGNQENPVSRCPIAGPSEFVNVVKIGTAKAVPKGVSAILPVVSAFFA